MAADTEGRATDGVRLVGCPPDIRVENTAKLHLGVELCGEGPGYTAQSVLAQALTLSVGQDWRHQVQDGHGAPGGVNLLL